ncbi:hypothetical protein RQP46_000337 [Phenoliferia psychrophenolica]
MHPQAHSKLANRPARRHSISGGAFESVLTKELSNLVRCEPRTASSTAQPDNVSPIKNSQRENSIEEAKTARSKIDLARTPRPAHAARPPKDENTAVRPTTDHRTLLAHSSSGSSGTSSNHHSRQPSSIGQGYPPRPFAGGQLVSYPYAPQHPAQGFQYPPPHSPHHEFGIFYDQSPYHSRFPSFSSDYHQQTYAPSDYTYDSSACPSPWTQQVPFSPTPSAFEPPFPFHGGYGRAPTPPSPPELHSHFLEHHHMAAAAARRQSFELVPPQIMGPPPRPWVTPATDVPSVPPRTIVMDQLANGAIMRRTGTCKFFDISKGFGFILDDQLADVGSRDIFVHYTALLMKSGFRCLSPNEAVEYDLVKATGGGYQALNVCGARGVPLLGLTEAHSAVQAKNAEGRAGNNGQRSGRSSSSKSTRKGHSASSSQSSQIFAPSGASSIVDHLDATTKAPSPLPILAKLSVRIPSPKKGMGRGSTPAFVKSDKKLDQVVVAAISVKSGDSDKE